MPEQHTMTIHEVAPRWGARQFLPVCSTHPHWKPKPCITRGKAHWWLQQHVEAAEIRGTTPWTNTDGFGDRDRTDDAGLTV